MPAQRPPGRGNFPPRGPRPTAGHAATRRPRPATSGPAERPGPQARREAQPARPKPGSPPRTRSQGSTDAGADRLQKILAHAGVGSRRACEELILQGRVTVGGQIIKELGTKVDLAKISVAVDGQKVQQERLVYFAVNKPKGYVSTNNDPSGRPRVLDLMPAISQRVYTVGRLDEMSVGLMLLTNDGELANKLAHPKFGVEKLYRVIVAGTPERETLNQLTEGIWLAEGKVRAKRVRAVAKKGDATILEMVLAEGKNREVRRMLAKLGHKVMMLTRVAVGPITLKGLAPGQNRPLTGREVDLLRRVAAGEAVPMPWATDHHPRPVGDRPRRPYGAGPAAPSDRRPTRDPRDQPRSFGASPPRPNGPPPGAYGPARPHGPGYRGENSAQDRRPGPGGDRFADRQMDRRPGGGPPRRPGMFQATPDDRERRFDNDNRPAGGPRPPQNRPGGPRPDTAGPRPPQANRSEGPRSYRDGPPQGGPRSYRDGPPQGGPRSYRDGPPQGGPRSYRDGPPQGARNDGPRIGGRPPGAGNQAGRPPRPEQRTGGPGSGPGRSSYSGQGDARPPRFGPRPGEGRPNSGNDRRDQQAGGPRPPRGDDRRPNGPQSGSDRRPPATANRRLPVPGSSEPTRKVIGLHAGPAPEPTPAVSENRPQARIKRPAPRSEAPSGPRPMPKRRPGGRRDDD